MEITDKKISISTTIKADKSEVWKKWTTKKGIVSFFASDCKIELEIGGAYEMYFMRDAEQGKKGSEGCKILSYLPERMLSFSWNAPPTIPTVRGHVHKAWVVILLDDTSEGVRVTLDHLGFLEGDDWNKTHDYFDSAWRNVLKNLEKSFYE